MFDFPAMNTDRIHQAREAVARALQAHRTLQQTIRGTNGTRPAFVNALADSLDIRRPRAFSDGTF